MSNLENKTQEQKEQITQEKLDREIGDFTRQLIPFGSGDIRAAVETALSAGKDGDWAAEQIEQWIEDTETALKDIDPCAVVYESLLQEARNDIQELTEKDILNDTDEQAYVYGNFMCTSLDYSTRAQKELKEIMSKVSKEDFTDAMNWLWEEASLEDA
jgi:hypothetical protein